MMHYFNRAVIYPQRIKVAGKTMPVYTMLTSMLFYTVNGYLIGHYFGQLRDYPIEWLYDPRFLIGVALFLFGFFVNIHSDNILINLREMVRVVIKFRMVVSLNMSHVPIILGSV